MVHTVMYMFPCYTLNWSHPLLPLPPVSVTYALILGNSEGVWTHCRTRWSSRLER